MQRRSPNRKQNEAGLDAAIIHEQVQVLLDHAAEHCDPACDDCQRMEQVRAAALRPFESVLFAPAHKAKPRAKRMAA